MKMPNCCAFCLAPQAGSYEIKHAILNGDEKVNIAVKVPFCVVDLQAANFKSPREQLCERLGVVVVALLALWWGSFLLEQTVDFAGWIHYGVCPLLALGAGVGAAWMVVRWIAPNFVHPKTRMVRKAVTIQRYLPGCIEVLVQNDEFAEKLSALNQRKATAGGILTGH